MRILMLLLLAAPHAAAQQKCDSIQLGKLDKAIPEVLEQQDSLAAEGLYEACETPTGLREALRAYAQVSPDMRRLIGLKALQAEHALWLQACPGGDVAIIRGMELPREEQRLMLHRTCKLDWLTAEEARNAGPGLELAVMMRFWLLERGESEARVRRIVRALARVEPIPPPKRGPQFEQPIDEPEAKPQGLDILGRGGGGIVDSGRVGGLGIGGGGGLSGVGSLGTPKRASLEVLHPMGQAAYDTVMRRHLAELQFCHEKTASKLRSIELTFSIDAEGKTQAPSVKDACLQKALARWLWPHGPAKLHYRVRFQ